MVLARYVLKEHVSPFLFSFSVIMFLLVVDLILQKMDLILGKGIPPLVVAELFFLNTAWMVALAIPMAVLVGTLMAFGRMSADNEISALRSLGVGVQQVVWPVLLAGALIAGALVLFNDRILPEFNYRGRMLMGDIQRKRPAVALEDKMGVIIQDFDNYKILIGDIEPETSILKDVLIYKYEPGGFPVTIMAEEGEIRFQDQNDEARLLLRNGEFHRVDLKDPEVFVKAAFDRKILRLGEAGLRLSRTISHYRTDREMTIGMMLERVRQFEEEIETRMLERAENGADLMRKILLGAVPVSRPYGAALDLLGRIKTDATIIGHKKRQADRYLVEIHKKLSIPVACIVFVLVGAPLGIRVRGRSPAVGAGISIGFFLMWWLFLIGGETLADRGFVPPWIAMWCPNIFVLAGGGWIAVGTVFEWRPAWRRR
jgi:lipopolysaccharide export system permease protein